MQILNRSADWAQRHPRLAVTCVLALALAARLLGIASRPLWYDEAFSVLFSEKGPAAMLVGTLSPTPTGAADIHPITYYSILWLWMRVFGESPVAVRALSVLAGLAVVLVVYVLAMTTIGTRAGLAAGLLAALAPFQVHYAQEIRMYVFLCLWLLLATYCYWRGSRSPRWSWWLGFAVFAALGQYTHNLAAFYLVALALWPLLTRNWRVVLRVLASGAVALVLYLPWLVNLPAQLAKVDQRYWTQRPELYRLFSLLLYFVTNLPLPGWHLAVGLLAAVFLVALSALQTVSAARRRREGSSVGIWLLYLSFVPPLLMFAFSQWKPVYVERALLPSGAIFCIWMAWALFATGLPRPVQAACVGLVAVGFGLGLYDHVTYAGFPYAPYPAMANSLEGRLQPGDVVVHSSKLSMIPLVYYDRHLPETYVADPPGSSIDTLAPSTQEVLGLIAQPQIESATTGANRVWFIIFDRSDQEYIAAGAPHHPQLVWLMQHYTLSEQTTWGELRVYLFTSPH